MEKSPVKLEISPLHKLEEALELNLEQKQQSPWKIYLITILGLLCIIIINTVPAVKEGLFELGTKINSIGWIGPFMLVLLDGLVMVPFGIPSLVFDMVLALLIKNYVHALSLSLASKMLGATMSFILTKYILKEKIRNLFNGHKVFRCIEHAMEKSPYKFSIIFRVTVLPLFVKNYGLAVPKSVTYKVYMICAFVTTLPVSALNIYLIRQAGNVGNILHQTHSIFEILGAIFMLSLSVCLFVYTARYTKKLLLELEEEEDKTKAPEEAVEKKPVYRVDTDLECLPAELKETDFSKLNQAVIIEIPQQRQVVELAI